VLQVRLPTQIRSRCLVAKIEASTICRLPFVGSPLVKRLDSVAELADNAIRFASVTALGTFQPREKSPPTRATVKVVNTRPAQLETNVVERLRGFDV
jgi:hypothetical protein